MGLVQIEQSELDLLRKERDDARSETAQEKTRANAAEAKVTETETKVEAAEAAKTKAEEEKAAAESKVTALEETANRASLKDTRWSALGSAFTAKLGDFTKGRLQEQASTLSDDEWDNRLKELEETTAVKRDANADADPPSAEELARRAAANGGGTTFTLEEIASAGGSLAGGSGDPTPGQNQQTPESRRQVIGALAGAFEPKS